MHTYQNYIAGADVAAADGRTFTAFNPTTGGVWGTFALAGPAEVDRAVKAAADAYRTGPWGEAVADPARAPADEVGRHDRRARRPHRDDRDGAERQAVRRDARAGTNRAGLALLLRRPGRQDRRHGHPARSPEHLQLHAARAARSRRRHHAVEFADVHRDHVAGPGARRGQHDRAQAVGDHVGFRRRARAGWPKPPAFLPASSTSSAAFAKPARRSSTTRWSRRCRSRGASGPAARSRRARASGS